jgi:glycerol-3-phosphate cytidylyltransferase
VGLSTDEFNRGKHKSSYHTYKERKLILESIRYVDAVIPEENWEQKIKDVERLGVDTFVIGDDWKGEFDFLKEFCQVVYLSRTDGVSTSKIKNDLAGDT